MRCARGDQIASLDGETVAAVIEAAHAEGLAAVVHVSTLETALEAMAFGADGLVHVWRDEVVSEADARRFAEADIFVVPTLSVMVSAEDSAVAELVQETDEALLSPTPAADTRRSLLGRPRGGRRSGVGERPAAARGRSASGRGHGRTEPGNRGGDLHARESCGCCRAPAWGARRRTAATSVAADAFSRRGPGADRGKAISPT